MRSGNLKIEYLPVSRLTRNPHNSRTHDPDQIAFLASLIRRFGFTAPVLIDEADVVLAGHGRLDGAELAGISPIPCVRLSHLTEAEKRAYVIADNRSAEKSSWDEDMLRSEINALMDAGFDEALLGFTEEEIDALAGAFTGDLDEGPIDDSAASRSTESDSERDRDAGAKSGEQGAVKAREKTIFPVLLYFDRSGYDAWTRHLKTTNEPDGAAAVKKLMENQR